MMDPMYANGSTQAAPGSVHDLFVSHVLRRTAISGFTCLRTAYCVLKISSYTCTPLQLALPPLFLGGGSQNTPSNPRHCP